jgi:flagellar hook-associated protein 2
MSTMRIGGIASGFDTEQIVRDLMQVERMKADKLYQDRQIVEWKKDQYRDLVNSIRSFKDKYFDLLKPETNMMSVSALKKIDAVSSDEDILTAIASSDVLIGSRTIEIEQLATAAKGVSGGNVTALMSSEGIAGPISVVEGQNKIELNFNGSVKTITINEGDYDDLDELRTELQAKVDNAFGLNEEGNSKIEIEIGESNRLRFETKSSVDTLALSSKTFQEDNDILNQIKIESGTANRLNLSSTMEMIGSRLEQGSFTFDEDDKFTLTINGENITIQKDDTLRVALNKINNSAAGVTLSYSSFTDKFILESKMTGEGTIEIDGGGKFFETLKITEMVSGQNVKFTIDGSEVASRSSNTFSIDGVTYTAKAKGSVVLTTSVESEGVYETIESFVNDYNSLIVEINDKLKEERFRDFPPLTDEEKEGMSEREIKLWEEKAQSGLLRGDTNLEKFLLEMRKSLYIGVGELHLTQIGIETSKDYRDQGKLVLKDGGKVLRAAIEENPDKVAEVFTSRLDGQPGVAHHLNDVLNDYIRTTRDNNGRKGILLERAGIVGDASQFDNYYDRQIADINKRIDLVSDNLLRKEERYYRQFIAMEKTLQQLYSQGDWLTMQFAQFQSPGR